MSLASWGPERQSDKGIIIPFRMLASGFNLRGISLWRTRVEDAYRKKL